MCPLRFQKSKDCRKTTIAIAIVSIACSSQSRDELPTFVPILCKVGGTDWVCMNGRSQRCVANSVCLRLFPSGNRGFFPLPNKATYKTLKFLFYYYFFNLDFYYFMHISVLPACMSMHHIRAWSLRGWCTSMQLLGIEPRTFATISTFNY